MGWGVYDYPSAPLEKGSKNLLDCQADGCGKTLPEDELFSCEDCGELFCEGHIVDLLDDHSELVRDGESGSIHLCPACLAGRQKLGALPATRVERREVA